MSAYQDIRINGVTVDKGERDCAVRYELIKKALPEFSRAYTLLDLGAAQGYFGIRFAEEDERCHAVLIDQGPDLRTMLLANSLRNTLGFQRRLSEGDLENLADCEHMDVVLALNILHHFPDPARALKAVLRIGEHIIIEVPGPDDPQACGGSHGWLENAVIEAGGQVIGTAHSHTTKGARRRIYYVYREKASLQKPFIGADVKGAAPMRRHQILSTPVGKLFNMPDKQEARFWFPGVNLQTFLLMGGNYPDLATVERLVEEETRRAIFGEGDVGLATVAHKDIRPWNFVLSAADAVTLIDFNDPRQNDHEDDEAGLTFTLAVIRGRRERGK